MVTWLIVAQNLIIIGLLLRLSTQVRKSREAIDKPLDVLRRLLVALYLKSTKTPDQ